MPFSVVIASQLVADPAAQRTRFGLVWVLITLQLVSMIATLNVVKIGLQGTPPPSTVTAIPDNISNNQAEFGGMVRLIGHQLDRSQTDRWTLDLYWQAIAPVDHPYAVFNQVVNDQGQIVAQHDGSPQRGKVLMSCWQPGDLYLDRHVINLTMSN